MELDEDLEEGLELELEGLADRTDADLLAVAEEGGTSFLAAVEMMRRLKDETVNQQRVMTKLTRVMLFLTFVILLAAAVEVGRFIGPLTVR